MMNVRILNVMVVAVLLLGAHSSFSGTPVYRGKIGVIAPLTGNSAKSGLTAKVGIELAQHDFQLAYPDTALELVIRDSQSNPTRAAEIAREFQQEGIRIVLAPVPSQELLAIKPIADANGTIAISPTSTAISLALEDSIIRLRPNDVLYAQAMADYMRYRGIEAVVPIYRNDVFGNEFMDAFRTRFVEKGGSVTKGVTYETATSDFASSTGELAKQVQETLSAHSAANTAVLTVSFGEIYSIFTSASHQPVLSTVGWYGAEDYVRDARIDTDPVARSFALATHYTHAIYSPHATVHPYTSIVPAYENLATRALKVDSNVMETRLTVMYDALWLAGCMIRNPRLAGVSAFLNDPQEYMGFSAFIDLDKNGDPLEGFYSFFQYESVNNAPVWALVGSYWPTDYFKRPPISYRTFSPDGQDKQVRIGLMFSLTGDYASTGTGFARMAEMAEEDINALLQRKYTPNSKIEYVMANTQSDPDVALAKIQEMKKQGVRLVVGPINSAELMKVADFANQNEMILISPSSTAVSLEKDDNIFRLTMNDRKQAHALAALLIHEGYRNVEGLYRNDTYGSGLFALFGEAFAQMGGRCGAGVAYDPQIQQFDGVIKTVETQVSESLKTHGSKQTAILMISFDEGTKILETLAGTQSALADLRWFGADGMASNPSVLKSSAALEMAIRTQLSASILGLGNNTEYMTTKSFVGNVERRLGYRPTAFDAAAYDAIWLFTLLAENQDWQWNAPFETIRSNFMTLANNTFGYRSINAMNGYGDCLYGSIDFYRIDTGREQPAWGVFAAYKFFMYDDEGFMFYDRNGDSGLGEWSLYR